MRRIKIKRELVRAIFLKVDKEEILGNSDIKNGIIISPSDSRHYNFGKLFYNKDILISDNLFYYKLILVSDSEKIKKGDYHIKKISNSFGISLDNSNIDPNQEHKYSKVVVLHKNIPPFLIDKLVNQYNDGFLLDFKIEIEVYIDQKIGDKIQVKHDVYGYREGDYITLAGFCFDDDFNLISFEEDNNTTDWRPRGFHISKLKIKISTRPYLTTIDNYIVPVEEEKLYTREDMINFGNHCFNKAHSAFDQTTSIKELFNNYLKR